MSINSCVREALAATATSLIYQMKKKISNSFADQCLILLAIELLHSSLLFNIQTIIRYILAPIDRVLVHKVLSPLLREGIRSNCDTY